MNGVGGLTKRDLKFIAAVLLGIYFAILCWVLFVNVGSTDREAYFTERRAHLVPFKNTGRTLSIILTNNFGAESKKGFTYLAVRNIMGNLILFAPFGLLAPLAFRKIRHTWQILLLTFCLSLGAEMVQYAFKLGVFDIDDIILNSLGAAGGFMLFKMALRSWKGLRMQPG
jgi:glycopeptide antibiotics resistance protein